MIRCLVIFSVEGKATVWTMCIIHPVTVSWPGFADHPEGTSDHDDDSTSSWRGKNGKRNAEAIKIVDLMKPPPDPNADDRNDGLQDHPYRQRQKLPCCLGWETYGSKNIAWHVGR